MQKFPPPSKIALADLLNVNSSTYPSQCYNPLDPKNLPSRPRDPLPNKKMQNETQIDLLLSPKTGRTTQDGYYKNNLPFNRTTHVTPDHDKNKKENSFILTLKQQPLAPLDQSSLKQPDERKPQQKTTRTDRSQKVLKMLMLKDIGNKDESKSFLRQTVSNTSFLRQTVSNTSFWQHKDTSPIKISQLKKNHKTGYQEIPFRKRIQSERMPAYLTSSTDYTFQLKHKNYSKRSSRETGPFYLDSDINGLDMINSKQKTPQFGMYSQRISQDKLTSTINLKKDKTINPTDLLGDYIPRRTSKEVTFTKNKEQPYDLTIHDFQLGSCKGQGRFGKVFPALHKKSNWLVAIKQIKKEEVKLMLDQFVQELKINLFAQHPNIVKMYGFFHDYTYFYILMEYMQEGSLYKTIKNSKKLSEEQSSSKLYDICDAVHYLHSHEILHRDIKPQNIVLSNGVCKLCDFGWATYSKDRRTTYCGTLDYVCPEILEGESYDNFVDIWAIGVLAYQMLTGKAPFYHISRQETMKNIMNCDFSFPPEMSVSAKLFIKKALQKNPDQRFTVESLLQDRFLSQYNHRG